MTNNSNRENNHIHILSVRNSRWELLFTLIIKINSSHRNQPSRPFLRRNFTAFSPNLKYYSLQLNSSRLESISGHKRKLLFIEKLPVLCKEWSSLSVGQNQDRLINEVQSGRNGQSTNTSSNDCWNALQTLPCILRVFLTRLINPAAKTPLASGFGAVWSITGSLLRYSWLCSVGLSVTAALVDLWDLEVYLIPSGSLWFYLSWLFLGWVA